MSTCAVSTCDNTSKNNSGNVVFHRIPTDETRRRIWAKAAGKVDVSESSSICSAHFEETAYTLKSRLMGHTGSKRTLTDDAVPTLLLPGTPKSSKRDQRREEKERQQIVSAALANHEENVRRLKLIESRKMKREISTQTWPVQSSSPSAIEKENDVMKHQLDLLTWKVAEQQAEIFRLSRELNRYKLYNTPEEVAMISSEITQMEDVESVYLQSDDIKTEMLLHEEDEDEDTYIDYLPEEEEPED